MALILFPIIVVDARFGSVRLLSSAACSTGCFNIKRPDVGHGPGLGHGSRLGVLYRCWQILLADAVYLVVASGSGPTMVSLLSLLLACLTLLMIRTSGKLVEQLHCLRFSTRLALFGFDLLFRRGFAILTFFMIESVAVLYKRCQVFIFFHILHLLLLLLCVFSSSHSLHVR